MEPILWVIIFAALAFDYINGFHDTANAIATVVSTRVLSPTGAILMAAVLNIAGALVASEVAKTIAKGIVVSGQANNLVILGAIIGAIVWNLVTWVYGIPSSSSHALIGGLVGSALAKGGVNIVEWKGVIEKVIVPLFASPLIGFAAAYLIMVLITVFFRNMNPDRAGNVFRRLQLVSSAFMAFTHGMNDAQKSMGIITLALVSGGVIAKPEVPLWVKIACAVTMGLGTAAGGWRIIKTLGHKIIRLEPVHGFAAETAAAAVIGFASAKGMPISTTHAITASIFGVGASKRLSAVRWQVARNVLIAWVVTIPASGAVAALVFLVLHAFGA